MHFNYLNEDEMSKTLIFILMMLYQGIVLANPSILSFPNACAPGPSITIATVGDVLIHRPLYIKGHQAGFESLWQEAAPYIQNADIAYANLEGPIAAGVNENGHIVKDATQVYTGYPSFNYPPALGIALKNSGFDIVSTANNHALDRFSIGIDKTSALLKQIGIAHMGTRAKDSDASWVAITEKNGIKIAWIACTQHTNDNPDKYHQILHCFNTQDKNYILSTIRKLTQTMDAIIITPHWGEEYQHQPNKQQRNFAHQVLEAGATAVIGSHPHVLQPLEQYVTTDGRSTIIMYSLGNFISYQGSPATRSTIILLLGLTKMNTGKTIINGVRFVPMYMQNRSGVSSLHLEKLTDCTKNQTISTLLPTQNALYSIPIITNPTCTVH
jgi:poly-gamma-glutamate capsule biosynthesis protein CapA/YwtB (metallophosphatase superfamily)